MHEKKCVLHMAVALLLMMAALCGAACAEEHNTAVIDAGNSTKLHLRSVPSTEGASKGLYFSGTKVVCLSDPQEEWVTVAVGADTGFMHSSYLRTGEAAKRVESEQPVGIVRATGTVNLRSGPSTGYEVLGTLRPDDSVMILGETQERWYYVDAGGLKGYVSGKLIDVIDENYGKHDTWQQAYAGNVKALGEDARYALIDLDGNDVPELAAYSESAYEQYRIVTYADGLAHVLLSINPLRYIEGGNRVLEISGRMDYYQDDIFALTDHGFKTIAEGEYSGYKDGWDEALGRYICQTYVWNGEEMSMEAYMRALDGVFDLDEARAPEYVYSYDEILAELEE